MGRTRNTRVREERREGEEGKQLDFGRTVSVSLETESVNNVSEQNVGTHTYSPRNSRSALAT